jgi:benzoyl-CoA 2,3-dioxygenase component B
MFTYFTDRDGKFQLKSLAESAFDPLSRTCRFMLTEEAHHMFVGDTGVARIVKRTLEVMKELGSEDPEAVRKAGAIDLPTIQRYLNFWFSSSLDLFGAEASSNAATTFANGIKGRPDEANYEDHDCRNATLELETMGDDGAIGTESVAMRSAMNEVVRRSYIKDCEIGVVRWNRQIEKAGYAFRLGLPHPRFNRSVGVWAGRTFDPEGKKLAPELWSAARDRWLPSDADKAFVRSLMKGVTEPGKMAAWIAPPDRGINALPVNYEYVRLA